MRNQSHLLEKLGENTAKLLESSISKIGEEVYNLIVETEYLVYRAGLFFTYFRPLSLNDWKKQNHLV